MIWTGGSARPAYANGMAVMGLQRLDIVAGTNVPTVLSYSLINPPPGATIDANGIITWTPGAAQAPGSYVLTTVVTDNGLPPLSATNTFGVVVNSNVTGSRLTLPAQTNLTVAELTSLIVTNTASDTDVPAPVLIVQPGQPAVRPCHRHQRGDHLDAERGAGAEHQHDYDDRDR